jgi:biopolymer transport protein ExbB
MIALGVASVLGLILASRGGYADSRDVMTRPEGVRGDDAAARAAANERADSVAPVAITGPDRRIDADDADRASLIERADSSGGDNLTAQLLAHVSHVGEWLAAWYHRTAPPERATWGGLVACGGVGLFVLLERVARLRRRRVVPAEFTARLLDRLHAGRMDCGQALDHCELNPSPAARVALAAVRRWGRPPADLERAVTLAHRVETERLRRNVGTLRRVAALAPLLGLLGTLFATGHALESIPRAAGAGDIGLSSAAARGVPASAPAAGAWGAVLARALNPLSAGLIIAALALVAYDGVLLRVESLAGELDRLGAETIEAIALIAPRSVAPVTLASAHAQFRPHVPVARSAVNSDPDGGALSTPISNPALEWGSERASRAARTPHQAIFAREEELDVRRNESGPDIGY